MTINVGSRLFNGTASNTGSVTPVQLSSNQELKYGVTILAVSTNSQTLYVGNSGVTSSNGFPLSPGAGVSLGIDNLNKVYLLGSGNIRYIGG